MPDRDDLPPDLGDTEIEVLNHLWALGRGSVSDVHQRIRAERPLAYTTVMTVMRKLADKGYLSFTRKGNAYIYQPVVTERSVQASLLKRLLKRVFSGSAMELVQTLVSEESLSPDEVEAMDRLVDDLKQREARP